MNFGLGLVLSFTDNATAGINNAVNSLNQLTSVAENANSSLDQIASLSALSVVSDKMGSAFLNTGGAILSTLGQIISKVNETGQTLMYAENQLNALYASSGKSGKEVIDDIQGYAKTSMFAFEDLIGAVTTLKSVGIEAFDTITSSAGNSNNTILDYASALASFAPQMRNSYGSGINAAIGALREYIAEGNEVSLKRGAGLDLTGILGEEKGATIEERTRQVADLIEQLGMMGMVDAMKNNPMTQISNMGDVLFQLLGMISSSGVYDKFTQILGKLAEYVMAIPDEELQSIANTIGSALSMIMSPLEWVVDKIMLLADGLRKLVANNPAIVKLITIGVAIAGVLLTLGGIILKITSAFSGLSLILLTFGKSFSDIGTLIKTGALKVLATLLPLTATIGLMYLAWKNDFAGIRTTTTHFVNGLTNAFRTAYRGVNGSVGDLVSTLVQLRSKGDFFSNLTIGLMKFMMLFKALGDAWNDFTLSEENYLKAKELGILPLIEAILTLKWLFGFFKQGFIDGWKEIGEKVKAFIVGLTEKLDGTFLGDILDKITSFLQKLTGKDTDAWYDFGYSFAYFTAYALAFFGAFKLFGKITGFVVKVVAVFKTLWGAVTSVWGALSSIVTFVGSAVTAILGFFGVGLTIPAWLVGAITIALAAIVALVIKYRDEIWEVLSAIGSWIYENVITPVVEFFKGLWDKVVSFVEDAIKTIKDVWKKVTTWIDNNVIKPISKFFKGLWDSVVTFVRDAIDTVKSILKSVAQWIYDNVIKPVIDFFNNQIFPIIEKLAEIVDKVIEIVCVLFDVFVQWLMDNVITPIKNFFVNLWEDVKTGVSNFVTKFKEIIGKITSWISENVITPIKNFFSDLWEKVKTGVSNFISSFKTTFNSVSNWIRDNVTTPIATFFSNTWDNIKTGVSNFITKFKEYFSAVVTWINTNVISKISGFFSGLWEKVKTSFSTVSDVVSTTFKNAINSVLNFVTGVINRVIRGINKAIDVINAIPGVSITKITELTVPKLAEGGIVSSPTTAIIGEAGTEAVMPLENNLGWLSRLANMISSEIDMQPSNTRQISRNDTNENNKGYLTSSNNSYHTIQGDTDNSIVFNEGAIQVTVQNASEAEAIKFAKKIMEYIKRQQELDRMFNYA